MIESNYFLFTSIVLEFPYFPPKINAHQFSTMFLTLLFPALKFTTSITANFQGVIQKSIFIECIHSCNPLYKIKTFYNFLNLLLLYQSNSGSKISNNTDLDKILLSFEMYLYMRRFREMKLFFFFFKFYTTSGYFLGPYP